MKNNVNNVNASTRGDFGHGPFLNLKGSLDIMSIDMYGFVGPLIVITIPPPKNM